jgi:hypothetical protein
MQEVIDSFSRRRAESAELLRSAAVVARNMRQASSEISAWCDRDVIRQKENEHDSRVYLIESIRYVMRIGAEAQVRHSRFIELATAVQAKREQLTDDAQELREYDMLEVSDFQSIRELQIHLLELNQWARDDEAIYEQAVATLDDLYARFMVFHSTATEESPDDNNASMMQS